MYIRISNKFLKVATFLVLVFQVLILDAAPRGGSGLGTPSGLNVPSTSEDGNITLTWNAPIGAGNLTEYIVQESVNNGGWSVVGLSPHPTLSWTATGREEGSYKYRVQACDVGGCSPFSSSSAVVNVLLPVIETNCIKMGIPGCVNSLGVVETDGDVIGGGGGSFPENIGSPLPYVAIDLVNLVCGFDDIDGNVACETEVLFKNLSASVLDGIVFDVYVSNIYEGQLSPLMDIDSFSSTTLVTKFNFPGLAPGVKVINACLIDPQNRITSDCWEYTLELLN